jgi:hypothetical protein
VGINDNIAAGKKKDNVATSKAKTIKYIPLAQIRFSIWLKFDSLDLQINGISLMIPSPAKEEEENSPPPGIKTLARLRESRVP